MNTTSNHRTTALVLAVLTTLSLMAGLDRLATSQHAATAQSDAAATQWLVTRAAPAQG